MGSSYQNLLFEAKKISAFTENESLEPSTVSEALKSAEWMKDIHNEYQALVKNKKWSLVPCSSGLNIFGNR